MKLKAKGVTKLFQPTRRVSRGDWHFAVNNRILRMHEPQMCSVGADDIREQMLSKFNFFDIYIFDVA